MNDNENQSIINSIPGKLSKCNKCKKQFYFVSQHTHLQCEPFQSYDGNEYAEIIEIGCNCPHCDEWLHLGYLNEDLLKRRAEITNNRRKRAFKRDYQKWQTEARAALKVVAEPEGI